MIIGLCGLAGSGKDTVADFLVRDHSFVKVALADPLKRVCKEVFDFTDDQLWGPSEKRNAPDRRYPRRLDELSEAVIPALGVPREYVHPDAYLTPRHALQQLGTEWGRNCYPNVWVDYALRVAKKLLNRSPGESSHYSARHGLTYTRGQLFRPGVVISDVRFLNEIDAIRAAGGSIWKINRPGAGLKGEAAQHQSEQEQLSIPAEKFYAVLENNGSLDDLRNLTGLILERSKA